MRLLNVSEDVSIEHGSSREKGMRPVHNGKACKMIGLKAGLPLFEYSDSSGSELLTWNFLLGP